MADRLGALGYSVAMFKDDVATKGFSAGLINRIVRLLGGNTTGDGSGDGAGPAVLLDADTVSGQPAAPKPRFSGVGTECGTWTYAASHTTPAVVGAVYAIIAFDSGGLFLAATSDVAASYHIPDMGGVWVNTACFVYWRTA